MRYETISTDPRIQAEYEAMRAAGESHNMAEMLALQQFPFTRDENQLLMKGYQSGEDFATDPETGNRYRKIAEAAGVSTTGKRYLSQLAAEPGDPMAWVGDASDVRRVAQLRNYQVRGVVNVDPVRDNEPEKPSVGVAEDIVEREVREVVKSDPGKASKLDQVREEVRDRLTPDWKKH